MSEGWIKLHRKMLDNPLVCKDGDYLAVWVYLLLNATHKNYPALFKGKKIELKAGQLLTGRKSISNTLSINEAKIQRILKTFENEQQIEQQTSNKNSLITILNWDRYQQNEQQNETQMNNKWTTTEQQVNTNKNVKNIYIILFNKYKRLIQENPRRKILIIGDLKKELDYQSLSIEEQDQLFYDLINPNR